MISMTGTITIGITEKNCDWNLMKIFILISLIAAASSAYGEIFTWVDSKGIAHYTNKAHDIPPHYRNKAKAMYQDPAKTDTPSQTPPGSTSSAPPQTLPAGTLQNSTVVPAQNQSAGSPPPNTPVPIPDSSAGQSPQQTPQPSNALKQDYPRQQSGEQSQIRPIRPRNSRSSTEN